MKDARLSKGGAQIVEALNGFLAALEEGGDIAKRFTVRTVRLNLEPRTYGADAVKEIRTSLGLSQALFARFLGVSSKLVAAWEHGDRVPTGPASRLLDEIARSPEHWKKRLEESIVRKEPQACDA